MKKLLVLSLSIVVDVNDNNLSAQDVTDRIDLSSIQNSEDDLIKVEDVEVGTIHGFCNYEEI